MANKYNLPADLVTHPRYGSTIRPGFSGVSEEELRGSYRGYQNVMIFPESTIKANITEQNLGPMDSRAYYVDILKKCETCRRHFIFHAAEQQYWYETLKFYIDAECLNCFECRQEIQSRRSKWKSYSQLAGQSQLSGEELLQFIELTIELWDLRMIRNPQSLRSLKNKALRQLPEHPLTLALRDKVSEFPQLGE